MTTDDEDEVLRTKIGNAMLDAAFAALPDESFTDVDVEVLFRCVLDSIVKAKDAKAEARRLLPKGANSGRWLNPGTVVWSAIALWMLDIEPEKDSAAESLLGERLGAIFVAFQASRLADQAKSMANDLDSVDWWTDGSGLASILGSSDKQGLL